MRHALRSALAMLFAGMAALPAAAAASQWAYSEGGRMRIAALADGTDGKVTAILEIEPQPGWKTYWRDPGDAGMPPQIDLSAARNLKLLKVGYPVPEIGRDEGGRFFGYHQPASVVLELEKPDPGEAATLSANVLVGLCKEICLPFQSSFDLPLANVSQPEGDEFMKIQMAKAQLPEPPSNGFQVLASGLTPDKAYFRITIAAPDFDMPEIAVSPSEGLLLGRQAEVMTNGGTTEVRYPVRRMPKTPDTARLTLLVKSGDRAMETTLAVK